jgi:type IV pilus assembly protein PilB
VGNEELVAAINAGAEAAELKRIAMRGGMKTLHQDGLLKVREGVTTMEEALTSVPADR